MMQINRTRLKKQGLLKEKRVRAYEIQEDGSEKFISNMSLPEASTFMCDEWDRMKVFISGYTRGYKNRPSSLNGIIDDAFDNIFKFLGYKPELEEKYITEYMSEHEGVISYSPDRRCLPGIEVHCVREGVEIRIYMTVRLEMLLKGSVIKDSLNQSCMPVHEINVFDIRYNATTNTDEVQYEFISKIIPLVQLDATNAYRHIYHGYLQLFKTSYDNKISDYSMSSIFAASKDKDNIYFANISKSKIKDDSMYERADGNLALLAYAVDIPDISESIDYSGVDVLLSRLRVLSTHKTEIKPEMIIRVCDNNISEMYTF